ncbi:DUF4252 domain-containing protein [Marinicella sp. W31]|uniref:DUF4252 domain-containing protein n=1 Tax=Marinicella sp. W31 TaxID=3023713 RepID=UPI003756852C
MKKIKFSVLLLMFATVSFAGSVNDELNRLLGSEPNVSINLGPQLLKMAAHFSDEGKEVERLMSELASVSVNVYELDDSEDAREVSSWLSDYVSDYKNSGVSELVRVVEDDERVHILADVNDDAINDLSILVYEPGDEFVHIELTGSIQFDSISDLLDHLDVDVAGLSQIKINRGRR